LKRFFGNDFSIPVEWDGFVAAVDSAYAEFVVDREFMERSMELSSQELLAAIDLCRPSRISGRYRACGYEHRIHRSI
jgi:hypothetical protein